MSNDFIPFKASTPTISRERRTNYNAGYRNNTQNNHRRNNSNYNRWNNNSNRSNSSYGSDWSNHSHKQEEADINMYLHPSMMQDPWAQLRTNK